MGTKLEKGRNLLAETSGSQIRKGPKTSGNPVTKSGIPSLSQGKVESRIYKYSMHVYPTPKETHHLYAFTVVKKFNSR